MTDQSDLNTFAETDRWPSRELSEVAEIILGNSPEGESYNEDGEGLPFLQGSKNFGNRYPSIERYCSQPKRVAEKGDVLISVRAPVGPVNIAPKKVCIGRGVTALRMKHGSNDFLFYYLRYFQDRWAQFADGTTFNSITKSDLQSLEIPYPDYETQEKIASMLSDLDEKWELNKDMNRTLNEISKSIFKHWFVDFAPFSEFKSTEIGEIPKSFEVRKLDEFVDIELGNSPKSEFYNEEGEGLPFFQGSKNFGLHYPTVEKWCTNPNKVAEAGDVLISIRAPVGDLNRATEECCIGRGVTGLSMAGFRNEFLYYLLEANSRRWEKYKSGTTFNSINKGDIQSFPIAYPGDELVRKFNESVTPMFNLTRVHFDENQILNDLRRTLNEEIMSTESITFE